MVLGMNFYGHNEKIVAGLTEADTLRHYLDLSAYVPKNCVAIIIYASRVTGTGNLVVFPYEGTHGLKIGSGEEFCHVVAIKNQRLQYSLTVANDVWNIFMFGYFVERVVGE
jgi:hypothetical protein